MNSPPDPDLPHFDTGLRMDQLTADRATPIETPWGIFAIYQTQSGPKAAQAFCPHMDGPLFEGTQANGAIVCPWHQWRFDLTSGACLEGPDHAGHGTQIQCLAVEPGPNGTLLLTPHSA